MCFRLFQFKISKGKGWNHLALSFTKIIRDSKMSHNFRHISRIFKQPLPNFVHSSFPAHSKLKLLRFEACCRCMLAPSHTFQFENFALILCTFCMCTVLQNVSSQIFCSPLLVLYSQFLKKRQEEWDKCKIEQNFGSFQSLPSSKYLQKMESFDSAPLASR